MLGSLFGSSSLFDTEVERVTDEKNKREDWGLIMDLCDRVKATPNGSKECLKSMSKRLNHPDPHVVMQCITLLDACVNNCGKSFMLEVASRDFENEFRKILSKSQPKVQNRLWCVLRKWAEGDFKKESQFSLIPSLYNSLKQEGVDFSGGEDVRKKQALSNPNPNAVFSQEEEDDIAKAIQLSLVEGGGSSKSLSNNNNSGAKGSTSLYPSTTDENLNIGSKEALVVKTSSSKLKARALYDFEAVDDNELTFKAGEIVLILDNSDTNWWKGSNYRGEGLFPSNFVTTDLDDSVGEEKRRSSVQCNDEEEVNTINTSTTNEEIEISEEKLEHVLYLLHEADPTSSKSDPPVLLELEQRVNTMGPLIDAELEVVDRKHAELTRLSSELVDALNLYHHLMREVAMVQQLPPPHAAPMYGQMNVPPYSQAHHYGLPPQYSMHPPLFHSRMQPQSVCNPGQVSYIPSPPHPGMHQSMNDHSQVSYIHSPTSGEMSSSTSMGGGPPGNNDSINFVSSAPPPTPPLANDLQPHPHYGSAAAMMNCEVPVPTVQHPYIPQPTISP